MSAWVRRLGWRVCIANRIQEVRRSPRLAENKGGQEVRKGQKGKQAKVGEGGGSDRIRQREGK